MDQKCTFVNQGARTLHFLESSVLNFNFEFNSVNSSCFHSNSTSLGPIEFNSFILSFALNLAHHTMGYTKTLQIKSQYVYIYLYSEENEFNI